MRVAGMFVLASRIICVEARVKSGRNGVARFGQNSRLFATSLGRRRNETHTLGCLGIRLHSRMTLWSYRPQPCRLSASTGAERHQCDPLSNRQAGGMSVRRRADQTI